MSEQMSHRRVIAFIALADAPTPKSITFQDTLTSIDFYCIADLNRWLEIFGVPDERVNVQQIERGTLATSHPTWAGHKLYLSAVDEHGEGEPAVDEQTGAELRQILAEDAEAES